jgi:hypothetical protein
MMKVVLTVSVLALASAPSWSLPPLEVLTEEDVYSYENPENGSGPLWSYGCTQIVRDATRVFVSQFETGKDIPPLCNTRWKLLRRGDDGWDVIAEEEGYRQREPCPLGITGDAVFLNVNDSMTDPGTHYKPCRPYLLRFGLPGDMPGASTPIMPQWSGDPYFTDHSYRGFAVDRPSSEILMLNVDNRTTIDHAWCYLSAAGETIASGSVHFPFRGCYSQAALSNGAAWVMAISDIVEPVEEWREYKHEQTGRDWDYVFRILYFTWSPDLEREGFSTPIEIANVDETGGHIGNQDLWVSPDGRAYLMYTERGVQSALLRDKFFPERSVLDSLKLVIVKGGKVIERHTLVEGTPERAPFRARFHEARDGKLYAVLSISGAERRNELMQIYPEIQADETVSIPLETPFTSFCLASVRAGNAPSDIIDIFGNSRDPQTLSYAAVRIGGAEE